MSVMPSDGFYEAGTAPTAPHPVTEQDMDKILEHAQARLQQLGATPDQALAFIEQFGTETVRAESDGDLRLKISTLEAAIPGYDPESFHVDEVVAYATEHPDEVAAIIEAEQAGKARKTLLAQLDELSTSADGTGGESEPDAGVEGKTDGDDTDSD